MFIANVTDLVDLSGAHIRSETGTKLSDDKWNTESLSILSSSAKSLLMEGEALLSLILWWLAGLLAEAVLELAAISVVVQHMH